MASITLKNLSKKWGPFIAVDNINLEIFDKEFLVLLGPSGCGKTTLLRAIAALEIPTKGHLTVNGKSPDDARIDREYGYVFQAAGLYPWRTVEGNIKLPLEIMGYSKNEQKERVEKNIDLVGLSGFEKKFWFNRLSRFYFWFRANISCFFNQKSLAFSTCIFLKKISVCYNCFNEPAVGLYTCGYTTYGCCIPRYRGLGSYIYAARGKIALSCVF